MEKQFKVYIICPMAVPQSILNEFERVVHRLNAKCSYWVRGNTYSDAYLRQANAVVVLLPNNAWSQKIDSLPSGTRSEINLAKSLSIPIYLGYTTRMDNTPTIYSIGSTSRGVIEGVPGSAHHISQAIDHWNKATKFNNDHIKAPELLKKGIPPREQYSLDEEDEDEFWNDPLPMNVSTACSKPTVTTINTNILEELQYLHCTMMAVDVVKSVIDLYKPDKRLLIMLL